MAAACLVLLLLLVSLAGSGAATERDAKQFSDLEVEEPRTQLESDGGRLEMWKGRVFEDANVAAGRTTLKPRGLWLPSYIDSPAMQIVTRGSGRVGIVPPHTDHMGHETTFRVEKGDVVAVPEGTTLWWYNDGDKDMEVFGAADVSESPRSGALRAFHLAGGRDEGQRREQQEQQQQGYGSVLHGFNIRTLARAWDTDEDRVKRILQSQMQTGIIRVDEAIEFPEARDPFRRHGHSNKFAASNFLYRLGSSHPDVHVENGGELREINSFKLPVLKYVGLGVECMRLEKNAMVAPNYFHNAHQVLYVVEGRGKVEVVTNEGEKALDTEVEEGSVVVIPAFYPSAKIASENREFHYISVVTAHRPKISLLAGRNNVYQGIPTRVLSRIFNVDEERTLQIQLAHRDESIILSNKHSGGDMKHSAW